MSQIEAFRKKQKRLTRKTVSQLYATSDHVVVTNLIPGAMFGELGVAKYGGVPTT